MTILFETIQSLVPFVKKAVPNPAKPVLVDFTATSGQTVFTLGTTITDEDYIELLIDGREEREGAIYAWTRQSLAGTITTTEGVVAGKWVRVKIFKMA